MKTTINNKEIEIYFSSDKFTGYGHRKITVELEYKGEYKEFYATTTNMQATDNAQELEGEEKYFAHYQIIENQISDEVSEWLDSLE